jgi:hypothetical protein
MVVSKQAYTVSAPWLNFNLADQFELAFIDAGLMDDWFDEFETGSGSTSGERSQHRVLRIIYDATKKYGTVYHWFVFRPDGTMDYSYSHQWDVLNNQPIGTARLDYLGNQSYSVCSSTSTTTCSHRVFATQVLSTTTTLTRYSSGVRQKFAMFLLKGGNNFQTFFFMPPNTSFQPYIDLEVNTCGGLVIPLVDSQSATTDSQVIATISFAHVFAMRNNIFNYGYGGRSARDGTMANSIAHGVCYELGGAGTSTSSTSAFNSVTSEGSFNANERLLNTTTSRRSFAIGLPCELAVDSNGNRTEDATPVFADIPYSIYTQERLPIDFGVVGHFTNNTMQVQDIFQVTPGVEEWEILANVNYTNSRNPSALVVARVI